MSKALFNEFEKQKPEDWSELLRKDLKGEPLETLLWKTQGVQGKPFYTAEDLDFEPFNYANFSKDSTLFGDRFWVNYQPIQVKAHKEANQKALVSLENGANGILFKVDELPEWKELLKGIQPQYCHLSFQLSAAIDYQFFLNSYLDFLKSENIEPHAVSGFIQSSSRLSVTHGGLKTNHYQIKNHGHVSLDLALALGRMIDDIDSLATDQSQVQEYLNSCTFQLTTSKDFFIDIAKHRSLRRLIVAISTGYGIEKTSAEIISKVGPWDNDIDDPHSFMLHATTEAMSAILGGTDGLIIEPFHTIFPSKPALAERMARNISPILREESYLDKMVDPAAGSYYIESLSNDIFTNAISLLKETEQLGGLSKVDIASFIAKHNAQ